MREEKEERTKKVKRKREKEVDTPLPREKGLQGKMPFFLSFSLCIEVFVFTILYLA